MQHQSTLIVAFLILQLDLSSWMMWVARGMKQDYLVVLPMKLVMQNVVTEMMLEWSVFKVMLYNYIASITEDTKANP